jgi:3-oxoacyl-[acyl-carrier protein] reductase
MDLGLKGRLALITGGSKGIGYAIAEHLAAEGCNVIIVARDAADLEAARKKITDQFPVDVQKRSADLASDAAMRSLAAEFPDIDILVNNAGAIRDGSIEEVDDATWRSYWDLKVFGYISLTRAYYTLMKARGRGVIINIIGIAGERMRAGYIAGSTGNASLIALTKALGADAPDHGVRVVGINPGPVMTEKLMMTLRRNAGNRFGDEERWPELTKSMPFGRTIKPVEVTAQVALLASDLAGYTSGTVINIDGGRMHKNKY